MRLKVSGNDTRTLYDWIAGSEHIFLIIQWLANGGSRGCHHWISKEIWISTYFCCIDSLSVWRWLRGKLPHCWQNFQCQISTVFLSCGHFFCTRIWTKYSAVSFSTETLYIVPIWFVVLFSRVSTNVIASLSIFSSEGILSISMLSNETASMLRANFSERLITSRGSLGIGCP